jgi:hypothetical protein
MPILGALLLSLFSGLATYLGGWFTVKVAGVVAALAAFLALNLGIAAALYALVSTLSLAFPGGISTTFMWVMLPDNALVCLSICTGVDTAVMLYRWNSGALQLAASV